MRMSRKLAIPHLMRRARTDLRTRTYKEICNSVYKTKNTHDHLYACDTLTNVDPFLSLHV